MGELIILLSALINLCAIATILLLLGMAGWYLSYPALTIITMLLVSWPLISYMFRDSRFREGFCSKEGEKLVWTVLMSAVIWGFALRNQISVVWDSIRPYLLR
jgi:RsiW-degrading membrane proteinase PrsW (M82 family)